MKNNFNSLEDVNVKLQHTTFNPLHAAFLIEFCNYMSTVTEKEKKSYTIFRAARIIDVLKWDKNNCSQSNFLMT